MTLDASPDLYFRLRDNGATVFRIEGQNRMRRLEMTQIASVNVRTGKIKPHGTERLDEAETRNIESWVATRRDALQRRDEEALSDLIERLNNAAHWAQTRATESQIQEVSQSVLLAMHDLRSVLVRKQADTLRRRQEAGGEGS